MKTCQNQETLPLWPKRAVYQTKSPDIQNPASTSGNDSGAVREKHVLAVKKLTEILDQYERSDKPGIKQKAKEAKIELDVVQTPGVLNDVQRDAVIGKVEGLILMFNAKEVEKSLEFAEVEKDATVKKLDDEETKIKKTKTNDQTDDQKQRLAEIGRQREHINQAYITAKAALQFLSNPHDTNKRALVLGNFKDEITPYSEIAPLSDRPYLKLMQETTGEYLDATAIALQDAERAGKGNDDKNISDLAKTGELIDLPGIANFRLDGSGMTLTEIGTSQEFDPERFLSTKIKVVDPKIYEIRDKNGKTSYYIRIQILNNSTLKGATGYIQIKPKNQAEEKNKQSTGKSPYGSSRFGEFEVCKVDDPEALNRIAKYKAEQGDGDDDDDVSIPKTTLDNTPRSQKEKNSKAMSLVSTKIATLLGMEEGGKPAEFLKSLSNNEQENAAVLEILQQIWEAADNALYQAQDEADLSGMSSDVIARIIENDPKVKAGMQKLGTLRAKK